MPTEEFIQRRFSDGSQQIIDQANTIIAAYQAQGFSLTLRQLYYQFVARGLIPNRQTEYKRLGSIINDARLAGLIDWEAIEDRTRNVRTHPSWDNPADIMRSAAQSFALDLWSDQEYAPEVWIEKDALVGVIEPVCRRWQVPFFACRGYSSQSEQWRAGKRFETMIGRDRTPIVFHLGDHDPSGIDMTRDNADRLGMFAYSEIEVRRLALNWDQVQQYNPPPNPAKETDSRAAGYVERFGQSSWELDALDPTVIDQLIETHIRSICDLKKFKKRQQEQEAQRKQLTGAAARWSDVADFLENRA